MISPRILVTTVVPALVTLLLSQTSVWASDLSGHCDPVGGQRGTQFDVKVQSEGEAHTVIFDCDLLKASPEWIVEGTTSYLSLHVDVDPKAELGVHTFHLVGKSGVTNKITLQVYDEPSIEEWEAPHGTPSEAQPVTYPSVIQGEILEHGEVDFYAFEVKEEQELMFEIITGSGLIDFSYNQLLVESELNLYEAAGSWFDPHGGVRLDANDETEILWWPPRLPARGYAITLPRLSYNFDRPGWYLVGVNGLSFVGSNHGDYLLRIAPVKRSETTGHIEWTPRVRLHLDALDWQEREFLRPVDPDWLHQLWLRSHRAAGSEEMADAEGSGKEAEFPCNETLVAIPENEPNDATATAQALSLPNLVQATIGRPKDVDYYKFNVESATKLAFEIRTPILKHPYISPRLSILNASGEAIFDNIYRKVAGDGDDWIKSVEPKTIYDFEEKGEYFLKVHDLTTTRGGPDFAYQLLVRPQIPHIGRIAAREVGYRGTYAYEEYLNLRRGEARKVNVVSEQEEGFDGDIAVRFEGLPPGVEVFPLTAEEGDVSVIGQVYEFRGKIDKEHYMPIKRQTDPLLFSVSEIACNTMTQPINVKLMAIPLVDGKLGTPFVAQEIPMMIVQ